MTCLTPETQHLFVPFRGLIVVDEMDCAELGGDPELLIGRGRRDDYSARGDGDLQGEDGDSSSSQYEDYVSAFDGL